MTKFEVNFKIKHPSRCGTANGVATFYDERFALGFISFLQTNSAMFCDIDLHQIVSAGGKFDELNLNTYKIV